jgi:hypothetical protein
MKVGDWSSPSIKTGDKVRKTREVKCEGCNNIKRASLAVNIQFTLCRKISVEILDYSFDRYQIIANIIHNKRHINQIHNDNSENTQSSGSNIP